MKKLMMLAVMMTILMGIMATLMMRVTRAKQATMPAIS